MVIMMELIGELLGVLSCILIFEFIIITGKTIYDDFHEEHECNCIEYDEEY